MDHLHSVMVKLVCVSVGCPLRDVQGKRKKTLQSNVRRGPRREG